MHKQFYFLFTILAASAIAVADDKPQLPEAPGKATVLKVCSSCHGSEIVLGKAHSEDGWSAIVIDMVQRGAQGTDDEFDEVVRYLTKNIKSSQTLPKININKASAKAIVGGLGLTEKEAQTIVDARAKAAFKSIDDLKRVAGVDASKIESKKDKLAFE